MTYIGKVAPLDLDGLTQAAASIGAAPEALWSLISVETSGCGFLPSRRPKILFERHVFSARTNHQFDTSNPDISNPDPGGYGAPGEPQYERLEAAIQLDETAALESASWGIGQIMGYQATKLGYDDVHAMVSAMCDSEAAQLTAVARFLSVNDIAVALANQRTESTGSLAASRWRRSTPSRPVKAWRPPPLWTTTPSPPCKRRLVHLPPHNPSL